ncbi:MAG: hypothetical protein ACRCUY_06805 [Thermoguttaceae bacterium]
MAKFVSTHPLSHNSLFMQKHIIFISGIFFGTLFGTLLLVEFEAAVFGAEFLKNIMPKSVEAESGKEYTLTEKNGPWMILTATFSGAEGRKQANDLVYELRKSHKMRAYVYDKKFEFDLKKDKVQNSNPYMRGNYTKKGEEEYAVLVGDFQSIEELQETMKKIKTLQPQCLMNLSANSGTSTGQSSSASSPLFAWRKSNSTTNSDANKRGPLYMSFAVPNPMMPPNFLSQRGVLDNFIERINKERPFSLLTCPGRYTIRIATFSGKTEMRQDRINSILAGREDFGKKGKMSELEMGEQAAVELCKSLRKQGFDAYEFHDYYSSIVTVGSFDYYGRELPDGRVELQESVLKLMDQFRGRVVPQNQHAAAIANVSYEPVRVNGIECDIQPQIIEVPKTAKK